METKNLQRYASTYVANVLNNMKRLLKNKSDIDFLDRMLAKNEGFLQEQKNRREKDSHPVLEFSPYELLIDFRKFMENYKDSLNKDIYTKFVRNIMRDNDYMLKSNAELRYFLRIFLKNGLTQLQDISEAQILKQIRNADAHGAEEVVLSFYGDNSDLKFKTRDNVIDSIELNEIEFFELVKSIYTREYNDRDTREIFLLNKEKTFELSRGITNEEQLHEFLSKRYMLIVNLIKQDCTLRSKDENDDSWSLEERMTRSHNDQLKELYIRTDDRDSNTDENIRAKCCKDIEIKQISEISNDDITEILNFVRTNPGFYKERVDIQRHLIAEVLRRKYIDKEEFELASTVKKLSRSDATIQYFESKTSEYFERDIKKQFELLNKIVFLTNKEKLFDSSIDYTQIDISDVTINYIKPSRNAVLQEQFFRRLRNSLTHDRYEILGEEQDGLSRKIRLWDEDKNGITFDAETDLKTCIEIIMQIEFLKEISAKYKENDDKDVQYDQTNEDVFEYEDVSKNPKQFKYLDPNQRDNKNILEAAIKKDRSALLYIGKTLGGNREYLKDIVTRYPDAIIYLKKYKSDDEFVRIALAGDGYLLDCVDDKYKQKEEFILIALKSCKSRRILYDVPAEIVYRKEFMKKAIEIDPLSIAISGSKNKNDDELVMLAVKGDGMALECVNPRFRKVKEIALEAIRSNLAAKKFVSKELYDDPEFCEEVRRLEKLHEEELIKEQDLEDITLNVGVDEKKKAEQFIESIKTEEKEVPKSE